MLMGYSFLPFQFGGKEVLQKAIPAVLESRVAPRVSDGQQCVSNWRTMGRLNPVLGVSGGSDGCCWSLQGVFMRLAKKAEHSPGLGPGCVRAEHGASPSSAEPKPVS